MTIQSINYPRTARPRCSSKSYALVEPTSYPASERVQRASEQVLTIYLVYSYSSRARGVYPECKNLQDYTRICRFLGVGLYKKPTTSYKVIHSYTKRIYPHFAG